MILQLKYFGMVAETIGLNEEELDFSNSCVRDLDEILRKKYSKLEELNYKYAVNQSMANDDVELKGGDEIALLPPFAGG